MKTKSMKKTITALLIMLLATSAAGGISFAAGDSGTPQQAAETLLEVLENSRAEITILFDSVVEGGGEVPEDAQEALDDHVGIQTLRLPHGGEVPEDAQEALDEADELRDEAQALYDAGDYEKSIDKATKALNKYGKVASLALKTDEDDETEPEEEDEYAVYKLLAGYKKAVDRLEKLKAIAGELTAQEIDISEADAIILEADAIILEAKDYLSHLEEALDQGDLEAAESLLGEVNGALGKLTATLQILSKPKKKEKMEHFINQMRHRVQQLETKMLRILEKYGLSEEDAPAIIRGEFQAIIDDLDDIDVDRDDVVDSLKGLVKETNRVGKDKDVDEDIVDEINKLNKHESKLNRYRERITELEGLGAPTDEILDEIDDMIDDLEEEYEDDDETDDEEIDDDFEKKRQKIEEEIAELEEKIAELKEEDENKSELEAELDEIKDALDQAEDIEDLEELEERLDELDDRIGDVEHSGKDADDEEGEEHGEEDEGTG